MTRDEALSILGLTLLASPEEVRAAYRDLALVWHPDRFGDDPKLRAKAESQLKRINAAYQALKSGELDSPEVTPPTEVKVNPPAERARLHGAWALVIPIAAGAAIAGYFFSKPPSTAQAQEPGSGSLVGGVAPERLAIPKPSAANYGIEGSRPPGMRSMRAADFDPVDDAMHEEPAPSFDEDSVIDDFDPYEDLFPAEEDSGDDAIPEEIPVADPSEFDDGMGISGGFDDGV